VLKKSQRIERVFQTAEKAPRHDQFQQIRSLSSLNRKIHKLERSLAERENEVWTLKQLLLYR
jgi:hypothetical protein